jgi:hypothetical protein
MILQTPKVMKNTFPNKTRKTIPSEAGVLPWPTARITDYPFPITDYPVRNRGDGF